MKKALYILVVLLTSFQGFQVGSLEELKASTYSAHQNICLEGDKQETYVYICTGKYAKTFHSQSNCRGLGNCKGSVIQISLSKVGNRRPCKICYK